MKNKIYAAALTAVLIPAGAMAQEQLSKEITVEREIVPEVRAASRLDLYPRQLTFTPQNRSLGFSDGSVRAEVNPGIAMLEPAATEPAAAPTPYRGYLDAGYFPAANASVSAGYAILSGASTGLGVWTQLNNLSYKGKPAEELGKETFRRFAGKVGVDFSHAFSEANRLEVNTRVGYSSFLQPWSVIELSADENASTETQNVLQWDLDARWRGRAGENLRYHAAAGFGLYNFSKGLPLDEENELPALHQTGFDFDLGVEQTINAASSAGVDLTGDFLSYNHFPELTDEGLSDGGKTLGVMSLKPFYRWGNDVVTLKAGVRLDLTFNSGKGFHVAPDVLLGVNPAAGFGAWLRLGGGERMNSFQSLEAFSPYFSQAVAYGVSNMPVTGDLGLRFGPFKGVSVTLTLAYASANNWLLPCEEGGQLLFAPADLRAWKAGAKVGWSFRKLLTLEASFESTLGNDEKQTWIEWRDRARHVLAASVAVKPVERLTIDLGYTLRMKRSMPSASLNEAMAADPLNPFGMPADFNLKDVSNLSAGAAFAVTDAFTVFARGENLLGTESYLLPYVPAQGATGLVGIGWKF